MYYFIIVSYLHLSTDRVRQILDYGEVLALTVSRASIEYCRSGLHHRTSVLPPRSRLQMVDRGCQDMVLPSVGMTTEPVHWFGEKRNRPSVVSS